MTEREMFVNAVERTGRPYFWYDENTMVLEGDGAARKTVTVYTLNGASKDSYNDIDSEQVGISVTSFAAASDTVKIELPPHSVNMIVIEE